MNNNLVKIRIRQIYAGLRPSEQKVADYILQYEGKASRLLMETVAQETGVSQPTVIRFVKAAGYEGFKDFKCALVQEEAKEQPEDSGKAGLYGFPLSRKDRLEDIPGKIVTTSVEMLALAKKAGAVTLALTNFENSMIAKYADILLCASNRQFLYGDTIFSRISQLALVDMIYAGVLNRDYDRCSKKLNKTSAIVAKGRMEKMKRFCRFPTESLFLIYIALTRSSLEFD